MRIHRKISNEIIMKVPICKFALTIVVVLVVLLMLNSCLKEQDTNIESDGV